MTAEQLLKSSHETSEHLKAKIPAELAQRAIPPVLEWGPARNRDDELETPAGLSYSD